jgi:hypothetical protein
MTPAHQQPKATSKKEIESSFKGYKMYLKDGEVVVEGKGKFSDFVALFHLTDVQELIKGRS